MGLVAIAFSAQQRVGATLSMDHKDNSAPAAAATKFSEADTYLDLNTGKEFKVIYDALNEIYNRDDLFAFELYVNTRTKDTMWLDDAIVVNNALLRDAGGKYRIDPMKVKRDGSTFRVKSAGSK